MWLLRHTAALPTDGTMSHLDIRLNHQCNSKQELPVSSEEPQRLLADCRLQPRWQQPTAPLNYRLQPWLLFYIKISSPNEGITVTVIYTQLNNGSLKLKGAVLFFFFFGLFFVICRAFVGGGGNGNAAWHPPQNEAKLCVICVAPASCTCRSSQPPYFVICSVY